MGSGVYLQSGATIDIGPGCVCCYNLSGGFESCHDGSVVRLAPGWSAPGNPRPLLRESGGRIILLPESGPEAAPPGGAAPAPEGAREVAASEQAGAPADAASAGTSPTPSASQQQQGVVQASGTAGDAVAAVAGQDGGPRSGEGDARGAPTAATGLVRVLAHNVIDNLLCDV